MQTLNVGLIGVGNIAPAYIRGCAPFDIIKIIACADILVDRARSLRRRARAIAAAYSVDDLLARDDIDIVRQPDDPGGACRDVSLKIIEAGKHAYSEKPLAINRADGEKQSFRRRRRPACAWAARRIPSWAAACRPRAKPSTTASSARRLPQPHSSWRTGRKPGIPILASSIKKAPGPLLRHGSLLLDRAGYI